MKDSTLGADVGREEVYAAERVAFDGTDLDTVVPVDRLARVAAQIRTTRWWSGPDVEVVSARSDATSSSARPSTDGVVIRLASDQRTLATLVHELAHALAGLAAGHGPEFRRAYLDVVLVATNLESTDRRTRLHRDQLADAFAAAGLAVGDRRWPRPVGYGDPIAL